MSERIPRRQFVARTGGALLSTGLMGSVLQACGSDSDSSSGTKGASGTVAVFVYSGYDDKAAAAPFLKQHDITVKTTVIDQPDGIITRLKAGGASQFDLVSVNIAQAQMAVDAGVVQPLDYAKLPSTQHLLSNMAELGERTFAIDGQTYGAPYVWGINALVYNPKLVAEKPMSWNDLLTDPFKGKLAMTDAAQDNFTIWSRVLGYDPMNLTEQQFEEVTDFLITLKKEHARTFTGSYDDMADQLARGDILAIASPVWIAIVPMAEEKGGTVTWTLPQEGGGTWTDGFFLTKDAPNPDAAYAWLDWMLGAQAQAVVAENLLSGTVNEDAVPLLPAEMRETYPYDDVASLAQTAPILGFPDGTVSYADWVDAWTRVQAA